ncbi:c-type cytochrome [Siccirubricoccus phaeus]|uniref:c-type cytochrome n=1 Tax=Siccirubricoccus phaeus TaxID=2595053 RepID=UPI0011F3F988|nr:c-type cytochrome [Siccirubricoccus phaeus]
MRPRRRFALLLLALLAGCEDSDVGDRRMLVEGDPAAGLQVMRREGCGACHLIPGLRGARGRVGPPLAGFARRGYIAGQFPNRAPLLIRWIREAPAMTPDTAMPGFALTEGELRDVAAYLYRLQ